MCIDGRKTHADSGSQLGHHVEEGPQNSSFSPESVNLDGKTKLHLHFLQLKFTVSSHDKGRQQIGMVIAASVTWSPGELTDLFKSHDNCCPYLDSYLSLPQTLNIEVLLELVIYSFTKKAPLLPCHDFMIL